MLSDREREILSLAGLTNEQIGEILNISPTTVQGHFAKMRAKYGVNSRTMLLIRALKSGEIQIVDAGFFNTFGQYVEDKQIVSLSEMEKQ